MRRRPRLSFSFSHSLLLTRSLASFSFAIVNMQTAKVTLEERNETRKFPIQDNITFDQFRDKVLHKAVLHGNYIWKRLINNIDD